MPSRIRALLVPTSDESGTRGATKPGLTNGQYLWAMAWRSQALVAAKPHLSEISCVEVCRSHDEWDVDGGQVVGQPSW